jgi:hypothetical protein
MKVGWIVAMNMNSDLFSSKIIPGTTRRNSGCVSPPHDVATIPTSFVKPESPEQALKEKDLALLKKRFHENLVHDPSTGILKKRAQEKLVHDPSTGEEFESFANGAYWYTAPHTEVHPKYEHHGQLRKVRDPATGEEFECPGM